MNHPYETQVRNFQGYHQHREASYSATGKIVKRWVFYICGFSFCNQRATVLKTDGSKEFVPINNQDRILINGKWYGRNRWNH